MQNHQERPSWDEYFLRMAEDASTRSPDKSTKHGCVLVDQNNVVISTGYNGPVQDIPDDIVCQERPEKYLWMCHAEENAVLFAERSLRGATAYITGPPCAVCFRMLAQKGIKRIVCGNRMARMMDELHEKVNKAVSEAKGIEVVYWDKDKGTWNVY